MPLHYKRDGTLDMRYTSSREAVASAGRYAAPSNSGRASYGSASQLHYKRDGTLDMRYTSSREAIASGSYLSASGEVLHFKKDGTLDMRYSSSRAAVALAKSYQEASRLAPHVEPSSTEIPRPEPPGKEVAAASVNAESQPSSAQQFPFSNDREDLLVGAILTDTRAKMNLLLATAIGVALCYWALRSAWRCCMRAKPRKGASSHKVCSTPATGRPDSPTTGSPNQAPQRRRSR